VIAAPSGTFESSLFSVTSRLRPLPEIDKSLAKAADPYEKSKKLKNIALNIPITNRTATPAIATERISGKTLHRH
jgi:uncharacterized membrane protein